MYFFFNIFHNFLPFFKFVSQIVYYQSAYKARSHMNIHKINKNIMTLSVMAFLPRKYLSSEKHYLPQKQDKSKTKPSGKKNMSRSNADSLHNGIHHFVSQSVNECE